MNKKIALALSLLIVFSSFIVGCSKKDKKNDASTSESTVSDVSTDLNEETASSLSSVSSQKDDDKSSNASSSNSSKGNISSSNENKNIIGEITPQDDDTSSKASVSSSSTSNKQNSVSSTGSSASSSNTQNTSKTETESDSSESNTSSEIVVDKSMTYDEYLQLTPTQQQEFCESFDTMIDFGKWYEEAKKTYEENKDEIEVSGNGSLDLDDYID